MAYTFRGNEGHADAFFIVILNSSEKVILLDLKAVVLTLARLLPAISSIF